MKEKYFNLDLVFIFISFCGVSVHNHFFRKFRDG